VCFCVSLLTRYLNNSSGWVLTKLGMLVLVLAAVISLWNWLTSEVDYPLGNSHTWLKFLIVMLSQVDVVV